MSRLIVVSNRVALPKEARAGGLASAMQAALAERGGLWFGWSGRLVEESERTLDRRSEGRVDYALLDLTRADYQEYYLGFANRTLWPLLHFRQALLDFSRKDFAGYLRVNRLFAEHVARLLRPGDRLWVHDYHLIPLGAELRRLGVDARIGFFLHVPLPPRDLLVALPHHEQVFSALAAYDLVGVQTPSDLNALLGYFRDECAAGIDDDANVRLPDGRRFRAGVFPIGIDTERGARPAARRPGAWSPAWSNAAWRSASTGWTTPRACRSASRRSDASSRSIRNGARRCPCCRSRRPRARTCPNTASCARGWSAWPARPTGATPNRTGCRSATSTAASSRKP
jgi:trehalose 6-phosphate synthase